ncbi:RNase H domain-containing protein [Trichonephila clavipes]|nr:RNase H domain-containing protein [Trichonephila clavipes]
MALRICSGAFRTSPVQSLYVNCHQLPLDLRRRKLSLAFYFKILSVPSHPLQNVYMSTSMKRLYDARPSNIRPFMDRMKLHISELDLPNVRIQQRNLFLFQPWNTPRFHYINPFCHLHKGFDIVFCWLPSHVGIIGNEQADNAAKSATTHLPLTVPLSDMKRVIMHHIFNLWQESWSQQLDNKLHSVKPVIGAWPVMPMRRTDVKLTRLRIGHTRFTHRHLLFGERAPECPSCNVSYTVHHILIDCPIFNHYRMTFFHKSVLTLSDLVGESPHQNLFAFIKKIGFLYFI